MYLELQNVLYNDFLKQNNNGNKEINKIKIKKAKKYRII